MLPLCGKHGQHRTVTNFNKAAYHWSRGESWRQNVLQVRNKALILALVFLMPTSPVHPATQYAAADRPLENAEADVSAYRQARDRALWVASKELPPGQVPLTRGVFLVAKPHIEDPRFRQTVILIVGHDHWGSIGLVINRPSDVPLEKLHPDWSGRGKGARYVYYGGPVEIDLMHFLIRSTTPPKLGMPVLEDVYLLAEDAVAEAFAQKNDDGAVLHAYVGYAGWSVGQLDHEIARGDWYVMKGDAASLFDGSPVRLWRELIRVLAGRWV